MPITLVTRIIRIGADVHADVPATAPNTGKEGAINDSDRRILRQSRRSVEWGLLWVLRFKMAPDCDYSCTRQSMMEWLQAHENEQSRAPPSNPATHRPFSC